MQYGLDLRTVICNECSFVFTNPLPARETYERFYQDAYADYYGHITPTPEGSRLKMEPVSLTAKFNRLEQTRPLAGCRLLEVGPGQGLFLWWAQRRGCKVLGVEPSPDFCRVLASAGLSHLQGTLKDVREEIHGRFDIIFMSHVLEHFYDPNEALEQCRQLLFDGGILAVEVPNILKPFRSLDRYFLRFVHPSSFSAETLVAMLEKHGFQPETIDEGGNDWRSPQSLFVLARKTDKMPAQPQLPPQRAEQVLDLLERYRRIWRWKLAPLWYGRSLLLKARRIACRPARGLKRLVLNRRSARAIGRMQ
jgi:2-polyprenyl-3-methyl-5-hydroxy-6-metoxy-1,4-benzoquinol methylase